MNTTSLKRHWLPGILAAALLLHTIASAEEAPPPAPIHLAFQTQPAAAQAVFPNAVEHILRHDVRRLSGGRLIDCTARCQTRKNLNAPTADAALVIQIRISDRLQLQLPARPPQHPAAQISVALTPSPARAVRQAAADLVAELTGARNPLETADIPAPALEQLEQALAVASTEPAALIRRRAALARAVELAPQWPIAYIELAKTIDAQGDHDAAIKQLLIACDLDPGDPDIHAALGLAYRAAGRSAEALSHYSRALALAPSDPDLHNNFGAALLAAGETDGAVRHFRTALEIEPNHADATANLGTAARIRGETEQARRLFRRAIELDPDSFPPRLQLADMLSDEGNNRAAQETLEPWVAAHPGHAPGHFQLALVLATRQKYTPAVAHLKDALRLAPDYKEAEYNLGLCYHYMNDDKLAESTFESAIQRHPDYPWLYYGLGLIYAAAEKTPLAEAAFHMALEKDPAFDPAKNALKQLRGDDTESKLAWPFGMWCNSSRSDQTSALPTGITLAALFLPALVLRLKRK